MDIREQRIMDAVDGLAGEIVDFAGRLVAEPSTLGNEASVMEVMAAELTHLGLKPERIPIDPRALAGHPGFAPVPWDYEGRYCLAAVRPADGTGGRSALFNGHLDVVSPEPRGYWHRDPFMPVVENGWLYGRGAADMKSGVAAMTYAVHALVRAGFGLGAPVTVNAVIEEECSGNGALASVAAGHGAEAVLIPEPFGPVIYVAQLGVLWFKVAVRGVPKHVQEAPAGTNAVEKSFPLIAALRGLEEEMNREPRPDPYQGLAHPINLNVGVFNGGDWPSTVPAACEFHCRLSYFPGAAFDAIRRRIEACVLEAAKQDPWLAENPPEVTFYGFRSDGHIIDRAKPALSLLSDCHRSIVGEDAADYVSTCTTDLRAFHFFGRGQATCFGPVGENIHGSDERVRVDSVIHTARVYALFLARWCGLVA